MYKESSECSTKEADGEYLLLGKYPYEADGVKRPIKWLLLEKYGDGTALFISKYGLDIKRYNDSSEDVTWETCSLRRWLNGEFYNVAFNEYEKQEILSATIINSDNVEFGTEGGNNTEDKLYVLSITEEDRLINKETIKTELTPYAKAQGGWTNKHGYCWWWLRSPGKKLDTAATVHAGDFVESDGYSVILKNGAARPCIKVNLYGAELLSKCYKEKKDPDDPIAQKEIGDGYYGRKSYVKAFEWYSRAAEHNNSDALLMLGNMHYQGNGVKQDFAKAIGLYRRAADRNNSDALLMLGICYLKQDSAKAIEFYRKSALLGNTKAQNGLGRICYEKKQYVDALKWYSMVAEQGDATALFYIGNIYYYGLGGIQKDYQNALKCYAKPAKHGNILAQLNLGNIYYSQKDYAKAEAYLLNPAEKGRADAIIMLGNICFESKKYREAEKWYNKVHGKADVQVLLNLGNIYFYGLGDIPKDYAKAAELYTEAVDLYGNPQAQLMLGDMHYYGYFFQKDLLKTEKYYTKAAEKDNVYAMNKLADFCFQSFRYSGAEKWYRKAAEKGNAYAQCRLGKTCETGKIVGADQLAAEKWYIKSAEQGILEAQNLLGDMYAAGKVVRQDYEKALKWYNKAAGQDDLKAIIKIGSIYLARNEDEKAVKWYTKAAEQDDLEAIIKIGKIYLARNEYEKAAIWIKKAAQKENVDAQFKLGSMYFHGQGVRQDYAEAIKWCEKAADKNNIYAIKELGKIFLEKKEYEQAAIWIKKAALRGNTSEVLQLGRMYLEGRGVSQNIEAAKKWFSVAAAKGNKEAIIELEKLETTGEKIIKGGGKFVSVLGKVIWKGLELMKEAQENMNQNNNGKY